jgi:hypothetical protein
MHSLLSYPGGGRGVAGRHHHEEEEEHVPDPHLGKQREPTMVEWRRSMYRIQGPNPRHLRISDRAVVDPPLGWEREPTVVERRRSTHWILPSLATAPSDPRGVEEELSLLPLCRRWVCGHALCCQERVEGRAEGESVEQGLEGERMDGERECVCVTTSEEEHT